MKRKFGAGSCGFFRRDVFLMLKDSPDYIGLGFSNEADDLHLNMTAWTLKRINFPYFSDTLPQVLEGVRRGLYSEISRTPMDSVVLGVSLSAGRCIE
ncbi:MAG: hypothetical protein LWX52_12660 [Deltaproteobacteria bacterium]|nr:hypothetical protein [Deltaproteobacteria bacterium]